MVSVSTVVVTSFTLLVISYFWGNWNWQFFLPSKKGMVEERDSFFYGEFPKEFKFGSATSAYQVEGAWNLDGKGKSNWDVFCHDENNPKNIEDGSNGDITCDQYHKYKEDVQLLKQIGAKVYRFSVAWTRILPNGTASNINQAGIDYYNRLINELILNGIEPMITLFHFDMPAAFPRDWLDEEIIKHFGDYARICYSAFGDRVKSWITVNEPYIYTQMGYDYRLFPVPNKSDDPPGVLRYIAGQNMLKAHAEAYYIYKSEFKDKQKGKVGIVVDSWWYEPHDSNSESDVIAARRSMEFYLGWILHPIFKGDYPPVMKEYLDRKSLEEGRTKSRLPTLEPEWISKIKGSTDFVGLNFYSTYLVDSSPSKIGSEDWNSDVESAHFLDPNLPETASFWMKSVPWGLRKLLKWIKDEYNNPEVIITENGLSTVDRRLDDTDRVEFYRKHINELLKAIKLDGCNVSVYLAWALLDVFEWTGGYTITFGIHAVDHDSPDRTRTPKASAKFLSEVFKNRGFSKD